MPTSVTGALTSSRFVRANLTIQGLRQVLGLQESLQAEYLPVILSKLSLEPFLRSNRARTQWVEGSVSVGAGAVGSVTFTPGADEIWHVYQWGYAFNEGTANTRAMMGVRPNLTALAATLVYPFAPQVSGGVVGVFDGAVFPVPLVVVGGDVIACRFGNAGVAAVTGYAAILREIVTTA